MASHGLRYGIELACTSLSIPSSEKGPNGGLMNDEVGASQCRISRQCRTAASGAAAVRFLRSSDPRLSDPTRWARAIGQVARGAFAQMTRQVTA